MIDIECKNKLNDIIWQFFSERVFYDGGMILYKEDYEEAIAKGSEDFLEGDFYIEFGEIFIQLQR